MTNIDPPAPFVRLGHLSIRKESVVAFWPGERSVWSAGSVTFVLPMGLSEPVQVEMAHSDVASALGVKP